MFAWIQKHYKLSLLIGDGLLLPGMLLCRFLAKGLLTTNRVCGWTRWGGKCITCGGTHFVQSLLSGQFIEAFHHNEFLFVSTAYWALSLVLLHPWLLCRANWAKKALRWMYNIPTLILFFVGMLLFIILRNLTPITWLLGRIFGA
jgi:hypothetical protein